MTSYEGSRPVDVRACTGGERDNDGSESGGVSVIGRYVWWAAKEINHINPNIDAYAKLIVSEFARLEKNEITIEEFDKNTPNIEDETPLNYIQKQIIMHYPE